MTHEFRASSEPANGPEGLGLDLSPGYAYNASDALRASPVVIPYEDSPEAPAFDERAVQVARGEVDA